MDILTNDGQLVYLVHTLLIHQYFDNGHRRAPTYNQARTRILGHQIKILLNGDRQKRVEEAGSAVDYILKSNPHLVMMRGDGCGDGTKLPTTGHRPYFYSHNDSG